MIAKCGNSEGQKQTKGLPYVEEAACSLEQQGTVHNLSPKVSYFSINWNQSQ